MAGNRQEVIKTMCRPKIIIMSAILLIVFQYLVNVLVYQRRYWSVEYSRPMSMIKLLQMKDNTTTETPIPDCPIIPPDLKGRITVNSQIAAWAYLEEQESSRLMDGGFYKPPGCKARHRVAIVIPYRDRETHLKLFLQNIHPILQRQQLEYRIFVIEMAPDVKFNRALLMNVGFLEAIKLHDFQCFIFHDVDLIPEDDRNLYTCPRMPRHMSVAIDTLNYNLPYTQIFGGVSALTREQFKTINGFSNMYFGWGGEDDDMYRRILYGNYTVTRYAPQVARYKMLVHKKDSANPERFSLLKTVRARQLFDGINSLNYTVVRHEDRRLFTWILVSVNMTAILNGEPIHFLGSKNKTAGMNPETRKDLQKKLMHLKMIQPKPVNRKNVHETVNWVPEEFKGELPVNLTKIDPLPKPPAPPKGRQKKAVNVFKSNKMVRKIAEQQALKLMQKQSANSVDTVAGTGQINSVNDQKQSANSVEVVVGSGQINFVNDKKQSSMQQQKESEQLQQHAQQQKAQPNQQEKLTKEIQQQTQQLTQQAYNQSEQQYTQQQESLKDQQPTQNIQQSTQQPSLQDPQQQNQQEQLQQLDKKPPQQDKQQFTEQDMQQQSVEQPQTEQQPQQTTISKEHTKEDNSKLFLKEDNSKSFLRPIIVFQKPNQS